MTTSLIVTEDDGKKKLTSGSPDEQSGLRGIGLRGSAGGLIGTGEATRAGKLEQSILNFKMTYPTWEPEGEHKAQLKSFLQNMDGILREKTSIMNNSWVGSATPLDLGRSVLIGGQAGEGVGDEEKDVMTKSFFAWKRQALDSH
jgi:hypothetical protein